MLAISASFSSLLPVLNGCSLDSRFQLCGLSYQLIESSYGRSVAGNCEIWNKWQEIARGAYGLNEFVDAKANFKILILSPESFVVSES